MSDNRPLPRKAASRSRADLRDQQKDWLETAIRRSGLTASKLAAVSGVSDTTLTRFLNETHGGLLSPLTIERVAEATGMALPGQKGGTTKHLTDQGAVLGYENAPPEIVAALESLTAGRDHIQVWRCGTDELALARIHSDDYLVVDHGAAAAPNDIVLAKVNDGATIRTVFRMYQPPLLVGAAVDPTAVRPEIVDGARVAILGVVINLLRSRS